MAELRVILQNLGLQEYFDCFIQNGFDSWDSFIDISEADLTVLDVKLGHRRKLQREIARRLGHPVKEPLTQTAIVSTNEESSSAESITDPRRPKRRYRRHPPRDPNAPTRPDTAYVAYVKFMRQDPEIASLPFVEIAKLLGHRWSHLSSTVKGVWIRTAAAEKQEYDSALAKYNKSKEYQSFCEASQENLPNEDLSLYLSSTSPGDYFPPSESDIPSRIDKGKRRESSTDCSLGSHQTEFDFAHHCSTTSASTTDTIDSAEISTPYISSSPATSVCGSTGAEKNVPLIESIWLVVSQEQATHPNQSATRLTHNDLLPHTLHSSTPSRNIHVQTSEPFDLQPRVVIRTTLEMFLQNINTVYCLVNPNDLRSHLNSTLDKIARTSNLVSSLLCICLALGCQTYPKGSTDMAVMWYEKGRKYLDGHDWSIDPTIMQILALISMYHMLERPATSSHYLDAAMRIGERNGFHRIAENFDRPDDSSDLEWLGIWNTIQTMHRILFLGHSTRDSMPRPWEALTCNSQEITYKHITAQPTIASSASSALSNILGSVQQQLGQSNSMPVWRGRLFTKELEAWLQHLPSHLSLPIISKTQRLDHFVMRDVLSEASEAKKTEILHLHSLYFGTMSLLKSSFLQELVTATTYPPASVGDEMERISYECLDAAFQLIDLCTALHSTSPFPVYAGLPQIVLFTSSLTCILGIIWQRRLLTSDNSASRDWLERTNYSLFVALDIFKYCAKVSEQSQRHYLVLRRILSWLEGGVG
ncbi:hypothetical protein B0O99DRAFT_102874 [Bisporella sp. PMI_857]|nr:hypothetical protein B0O99DRAFT_102874 [Bisporella sp. PMI_857]